MKNLAICVDDDLAQSIKSAAIGEGLTQSKWVVAALANAVNQPLLADPVRRYMRQMDARLKVIEETLQLEQRFADLQASITRPKGRVKSKD